jgi:hypothetical protein
MTFRQKYLSSDKASIGDRVRIMDESIIHKDGRPVIVTVAKITNGICEMYSHDNYITGEPIYIPITKDCIVVAASDAPRQMELFT